MLTETFANNRDNSKTLECKFLRVIISPTLRAYHVWDKHHTNLRGEVFCDTERKFNSDPA